jgi:cyclase
VPIPRVIPTLLLHDEAFVKTTRYADPRYVGDPINVINLFNRFEVDEIVLLDILATKAGTEPPYPLIESLAGECWVPLTYGGGIQTHDQARRVLGIGAEKVVLGTVAVDRPDLVSEIAATFGAQAVVVSVDARPSAGRYESYVLSGTRAVGIDPVELAQRAEMLGAGEILLNAIDRDGTMAGFDLELIRAVAANVGIPVVASGGASSRRELVDPVRLGGASAVAAGSLFVFSGPGKGVLVNFPARSQLEEIFAAN